MNRNRLPAGVETGGGRAKGFGIGEPLGEGRYAELFSGFSWEVPTAFNIATACVDSQPANSLALVDVRPDGSVQRYTFGDVVTLTNRLANALAGLGVRSEHRVAIALPQRIETALAYLALFKLEAIAVPLSPLLGEDAIRFRILDSDATAVVTTTQHVDRIASITEPIGGICVITTGPSTAPHRDFWDIIGAASARFKMPATPAERPCLLIYTSGTTAAPKGALHAHRALLGHMPGFDLSHDFYPQVGDLFWTPADWAWIGGLMDALLPSLLHGTPIIAAERDKFDPHWAVQFLAQHRVRNVFFPPTALKMMRHVNAETSAVQLRTIMCGGESLGEEMLEWTRGKLGVTVNEIYGQTECNYVVGNCASAWDVRPGSMGRPYPGHNVRVLDATDSQVPDGEIGEIAVGAPDPVMFLEYWKNPDATRDKFTQDGKWLLTGDLAARDAEGYLWFQGRNDDVINSAGYRIGPAEVEGCLMRHPAVGMAAVIGVPDPIRGEAVKAFVQLVEGQQATPALEDEIRQIVKDRLAAYLYPRYIEFVADLPLTTTGKIRRSVLRERERDGGSGAPART